MRKKEQSSVRYGAKLQCDSHQFQCQYFAKLINLYINLTCDSGNPPNTTGTPLPPLARPADAALALFQRGGGLVGVVGGGAFREDATTHTGHDLWRRGERDVGTEIGGE